MALTRRRAIISALGILASGTALAAGAKWSRPNARLTLLPMLEKRVVSGWLGPNSLLCFASESSYDVAAGLVFDLSTNTTYPLPPLPTLPPFTTTAPDPSPDGRWVLYKECIGGPQWDKTPIPHATRWRLVRTDGSETRLFPPDGSFHPAPDEDRSPSPIFALPTAYWLPDSSGWISVPDVSDTGTLERFRLDAPDSSPERLVFPGMGHKSLEGITPEGRLVFTDCAELTLQFCEPHSGSRPTPPFRLMPPMGLVCSFAVSGQDVLALVREVPKTRFAAWLARLLHRPEDTTELWRFPLDGSHPTRIEIMPPETYFFDASPDGKRVFLRSYDEQTYLLTLTRT
ncbi:hypothetical protein [Armatimonas sp.]|uniref:hypothetical protein n=1 Tax=Armatimonas sp. TaxID=1872638 RepID=UPI00286D0D7A|nr:hypothetical protein [Armatimonas sp.]